MPGRGDSACRGLRRPGVRAVPRRSDLAQASGVGRARYCPGLEDGIAGRLWGPLRADWHTQGSLGVPPRALVRARPGRGVPGR